MRESLVILAGQVNLGVPVRFEGGDVVIGRLVFDPEDPVPDGELGHDLLIGVVAAEAVQLSRAEGCLVELDGRSPLLTESWAWMPGPIPLRSATGCLRGCPLGLGEPGLLIDAKHVIGGIGEPREHLTGIRIDFPNDRPSADHDRVERGTWPGRARLVPPAQRGRRAPSDRARNGRRAADPGRRHVACAARPDAPDLTDELDDAPKLIWFNAAPPGG